MSTLMKDQGLQPRSGRVYGNNESSGARMSGHSLASNATAVSSSSGGSASTMTQDLYTKSRHSGERRKKTRRKSADDTKIENNLAESPCDTRDVDVFKFLVNGDPVESTQPEMEMKETQLSLIPRRDVTIKSDNTDLEEFYRSPLSDSGISMGSSLGDSQTESLLKQPLPPLIEEATNYSALVPSPFVNPVCSPGMSERQTYTPSVPEPVPYPPSAVESLYHHDAQMWSPYPPAGYTPEPMPLSPASVRSYPYPHEYAYHSTPDPPSAGEYVVPCLESAPLVFRDKGSKDIPPPQLFRTFSKVSTRMLLQMQSNIAELEHELAVLDAKTLSTESASRRRKSEHGSNNVRHGTRDQAHRTDLYQELHSCLDQYYDTLKSYHQISQITSASQPADATTFKSWLQTHITPISKVPSLVGDGTDLVRIGRPPNEVSDQILQVLAYSVFTNVFIPLLLFKLSSGVLSRLIILSSTTVSAILVLDRHRSNAKVELGHLYWQCIIGCVGICLVAALLF